MEAKTKTTPNGEIWLYEPSEKAKRYFGEDFGKPIDLNMSRGAAYILNKNKARGVK